VARVEVGKVDAGRVRRQQAQVAQVGEGGDEPVAAVEPLGLQPRHWYLSRRETAGGLAVLAKPVGGRAEQGEVEVLVAVHIALDAAAGRTSGKIATELFISTRTAEHHIQNIYTKIGVSNRAAATRWAMAHRVVDDAAGG
jgi:hypothetical protein